MITSWEALKLRIRSKKDYLSKKYLGISNPMTEEESIVHQQYLEASLMVDKIIDRYHLKPNDVEVDLFRAQDDDLFKVDSTSLGWKKAALKGVNIHNISGNHLSIVAPPNDKILARLIQDILDKRHEST